MSVTRISEFQPRGGAARVRARRHPASYEGAAVGDFLNVASEYASVVGFVMTVGALLARRRTRPPVRPPQGSATEPGPVFPQPRVIRSRYSKPFAVAATLLAAIAWALETLGLAFVAFILTFVSALPLVCRHCAPLFGIPERVALLLVDAVLGSMAAFTAGEAIRLTVRTFHLVGAAFVYDPEYNSRGDQDSKATSR